MAYREGKKQQRVAAAQEGLVVDMVRQFADPYAFVRELVQNGIDAGASHLQVSARHAADGTAIFSVLDDGEGMDRETIEGPLLTLFSSAKDGDSGKIGKYGVGFVSVFAIEPSQVVVETWREQGGYVLRLSPDHSYELETGERREGEPSTGTRVSLHKPMDADSFYEHARGVEQSLSRWCRHAHLPIHWTVEREGSDEAPRQERVDRPLEVLAAVQIRVDLEGASFVVGPARGSRYLSDDADASHDRCFAGLYNRGLTLHESDQPPSPALAEVRFKVDSPLLQHTLSRDNVRHDEGYRRVLTQVRELVEGPLRRALIADLGRMAEEVAGRDGGDEEAGRRYVALVAAACSATIALEPSQVAVPLAGKLGGSRVCTAADLLQRRVPVLFTPVHTKLSAEVIRTKRPVLLAVHPHVPELLSPWLEHPFEQVDHVFSLVQEASIKATAKSDRALLRHTRRALSATGLSVPRLRLGRAFPQESQRRAVVALSSARKGGWHLEPVLGRARWSGWLGKVPPLVLLSEHRAVAAARELARADASAAGGLLARYLLTEDRGELSKSVSDALLEAQGAGGKR